MLSLIGFQSITHIARSWYMYYIYDLVKS